MIKNSKIAIKIVLAMWLIVFSIYSIIYVVKTDMWVEYRDCGQVVGSSSEDRPIKHGTQTDLYLLMKFDKQGFKAQEVGPTTYYQYKDKIGTTLCFNQTDRNKELDGSMFLVFAFGILSIIVYGLFIIYGICTWLE